MCVRACVRVCVTVCVSACVWVCARSHVFVMAGAHLALPITQAITRTVTHTHTHARTRTSHTHSGDRHCWSVLAACTLTASARFSQLCMRLLFLFARHQNEPPHQNSSCHSSCYHTPLFTLSHTQVWCHGSGCVGTVAYGLYGSATLLWGISSKTRQSGQFTHFWTVMTFIVNALIFFYVGSSCVNFFIRWEPLHLTK